MASRERRLSSDRREDASLIEHAAAPRGTQPARGADFGLLVRCRSLQLRNLVDQQLRDSPWRTLAVLVLLVVIWMTLYALLNHLLGQMRSWGAGVGIAMFPN